MQTRSKKPVSQQDKTKTKAKPLLQQEKAKPKAKSISQKDKTRPLLTQDNNKPVARQNKAKPKAKPLPQQDNDKPIPKIKNVSKTPAGQSGSSVISKSVSVSSSSPLNTRSTRGSRQSLASASTSRSLSSVRSTAGSSASSLNQNEQKAEAKSKNGTKSSESLRRTPVWKKNSSIISVTSTLFDFKAKRRSTRVSQHKNKDVYEFSFEDNKENMITKKKKRKPQVRKKKLKPSMKTAMLTTGPMNKPLTNEITASAFYAQKKINKLPPLAVSDNFNDNDHMIDSHFDDETVDDAGYEASISVANDTENTTSMSLANPPISVLPTPKTTLRFPATSSTPYVDDERYEYNSFTTKRAKVPLTSEEEVKLCFGFDESEDDLSIGLSPVKKTKQLSILHQVSMATFSNVEEIDQIPFRYSPDFKRPLPLNFEKENTKPIRKKRCTSTKNTKENKKRERKEESNCLLNSSELSNYSVLFELNKNERLMSPLKNSNKSISNKVLESFEIQKVLSNEEESFSAPPKKSYDRRSVEAVKQRNHYEVAGGYPTTETETEDEEPLEAYRITRRKRREKMKLKQKDENCYLVPNTYRKKTKTKATKENITPPARAEKSQNNHEKKKNKLSKDNEDWMSDINSHFSEIDDMDLMIE